jgi:sugar phosphate isomerase/epimerase
MKIATTTRDFYNYNLSEEEIIYCYKNTNFKYIDYCFYTVHANPNSPYMQDSDKAWKTEIESILKASKECGIKFVQAHAPTYNPAQKNNNYNLCIRAMQRTIEACHLLGIPTTVMHTSFSPIHQYPNDWKEYFKYNKKFVGDLLSVAEKYGINVCIENTSTGNMGNCYFPRKSCEMNDFIAYVNHPLLGACWDTGHAVMEKMYDQYDAIKELGSNLKAVHIHDNGTFSDQHLAPFCGKLQLDSVIKGLIDINYKGTFTYESTSFLSNINGNGPLKQLPLDLKIDCVSLLYKIGKFALSSYGIFEE